MCIMISATPRSKGRALHLVEQVLFSRMSQPSQGLEHNGSLRMGGTTGYPSKSTHCCSQSWPYMSSRLYSCRAIRALGSRARAARLCTASGRPRPHPRSSLAISMAGPARPCSAMQAACGASPCPTVPHMSTESSRQEHGLQSPLQAHESKHNCTFGDPRERACNAAWSCGKVRPHDMGGFLL